MAGVLRRWMSAGLVVCGLLCGCSGSKADPQGLRQQLAAALPLRSTQVQVLNYLNSQKINHSKYRRDETSGNVIEAEVPAKAAHSLVQPSYDVVFRFDDQGLLVGFDVQYLGYVGL